MVSVLTVCAEKPIFKEKLISMPAKIKEIEKEAKSLLSKEGFYSLLHLFHLAPGDSKNQINKYLMDTDNRIRTILPQATTLRVRQTTILELQFKLPLPSGENKEYEDPFDLHDSERNDLIFRSGKIFPGNVREALKENGINPNRIYYLGDATTKRYRPLQEVIMSLDSSWENARIYLDETMYPGGEIDYELEVESDDLRISEAILCAVLEYVGLEKIPAPNKINRFYKALAGHDS